MAQMNLQMAQKQKEIKQRKSKDNFSILKFLAYHAPYIYIWCARILCTVIAYYYHSSAGFVMLTWTLMTFLIPLVDFIKLTVYFFTPLLTFVYFYLYFINIPGFILEPGVYESDRELFQGEFGIAFRYPPLECLMFTLTITFLVLLIPSRKFLKLQRDEVRVAIFTYLSDKNTNFLL
jgi:hypothetical protein